ncbi:hypothetical protein CDL12_16105 [Handroanthus impetiginosus]|uniref:Uncharacterized protein n=1 Tax=Handroanthus impetiginosus TaxID=429701 RepID=A0A2G9H198_9LAMI|nr:hypothetical protein CDL12_16105 [Handroanthus impetiginosus]
MNFLLEYAKDHDMHQLTLESACEEISGNFSTGFMSEYPQGMVARKVMQVRAYYIEFCRFTSRPGITYNEYCNKPSKDQTFLFLN